MLSGIGATVVLLAVIIGGVLLITGKTLPELIKLIRTWVDGISAESERSEYFEQSESNGAEFERGSPVFYDIELDEEKVPRREKRKAIIRRDSNAAAGQTFAPTKVMKGEAIQMPLGPGAQASSWALPTLDMLSVTRHAQADEIRIRQRGRHAGRQRRDVLAD